MAKPATLPPRLLTSRQAAEMLNIGERSLWTMRQTGQLPFVKIGKSVRIPVAAIDKWIADQQHTVGGCN